MRRSLHAGRCLRLLRASHITGPQQNNRRNPNPSLPSSATKPLLQDTLSFHRYNQVYAVFRVPSAMNQPTQSEINPAFDADHPHQLAALLQAAGIAPLDHIGWIRITGTDRVRWLNGMVTNSIQQLKPGEGNYSFLLSVQGRIQGDAYIFAEPDALLLETSASQISDLTTLLDRFIIMDDVELADVSPTRSGLLIAGPQAAATLSKIGLSVDSLGALERRTSPWNATEVTVIHAYSPLTPRFELWIDPAAAAELSRALRQAGAIACEPQTLDWLRILEGTPLYGTDIRDRELPQETAQSRALHFAKGCYLGQEIVERIRSRGNVHRTFAAFRLDGQLPPAASKLEADGKEIGELTSIAAIPLPASTSPVQLALGYVRREALDRGGPLLYPGGVAVPVSLPFLTTETPPQLRSIPESPERV
jgi:folate-binding protein YgfZ